MSRLQYDDQFILSDSGKSKGFHVLSCDVNSYDDLWLVDLLLSYQKKEEVERAVTMDVGWLYDCLLYLSYGFYFSEYSDGL